MPHRIGRGLLLIGNFPPPFGGVPKHLEDLVPHLVRQGWDVHVLSGGRSGIQRGQGFTVYRDTRSRVRRGVDVARFLAWRAISGRPRGTLEAVHLVSWRARPSLMARVELASRIVKRHDIAVISAYNLLHGVPVGLVVAELFGIPLVVTNLGEIYSHRHEIARHLPLLRHVVARAARLTAPTVHCAESYREVGIDAPVRVIHHGVDTSRFSTGASGAEIRRRYGIAPDVPLVLFVGRLIAEMGLHTLLAAIPLVLASQSRTRFLIAGASGALAAGAQAAATRWPINVNVAVDVPPDDLPHFYAAATLLVAPTQGDRACGSLAAAEAMAQGKPVLATRVGGIPEFVSDGETGVLIAPDDPAALATSIVQLLNDPQRLATMGARGRVRVMKLFDAAKTNDQIEQLFAEAAEQQ